MYILSVGHGAIVSSPSGSVIANVEGTVNAITLICNVTRDESQRDTYWSIANFRGVAGRQSLLDLESSQNLFVDEGLFFNKLIVTIIGHWKLIK